MTVERDDCRAAFEKWYAAEGKRIAKRHSSWLGWQARAALEAKPAATQGDVEAVAKAIGAYLRAEPECEINYPAGDTPDRFVDGVIYLDRMAKAAIAAMPIAQPVLTEQEKTEALDVIAEMQANGWGYGTHPREKARIVLSALLETFEIRRKP